VLKGGGTLLGIHPEGTRNRGNPYEFLPFRSGVGRIIHGSRARVIPVFTNGLLLNGVARQVVGNFRGNVEQIHTVFGAPIDFGDLLDQPRSPKLFQAIADKTHEAIRDLAQEEREIRASYEQAAVQTAS
jgi:1-acyl-sn-glycerol-3-phosphate acyltransferase